MRFIHGLIAILLCFILLGLVPLAGAAESGSSDDEMMSEDWSPLSGMDMESLGLETLFSEELINGLLQFLINLFLSLFGVSFS